MPLYNQCCTLRGHCAIFRFCHMLPPLGSCTRIRLFGFSCQLSHRLAVGSWASHLASLGLREDFFGWPVVALPFLVWNSVVGLMGLLPLSGSLGWGDVENVQKVFPLKTHYWFLKVPCQMSLGKGEADRFVNASWLWVAFVCPSPDPAPPSNSSVALLNEYLILKHICSDVICILGVSYGVLVKRTMCDNWI